jgi:methionine-rich copper-binding protein CopC
MPVLSLCSRACAAVVLGAAVAVGAASPASAHAKIVSTDPADVSTLTSAPTAVTLTFDEPVLTTGAAIVATSADGTAIALGAPTFAGPAVSASWPTSAPGGVYRISWRIVADDGHPETGTFGFTLAGAPTASASVATPGASPASSTTGTDGSSSLPVVLGLGALAVVVVAGAVVVVRRRGGSTA